MEGKLPGSEAPRTAAAAPALRTLEVGWFDASSTLESLVVDYPGNEAGPLAARTTLVLELDALQLAIQTRQGVVLQFERGDPARPIATGLLQGEQSELVRLLARPAEPAEGPDPGPQADAATREPMQVEVSADGERVELRASSEISLRCGAASITLTRDGRVVVRGSYVETQSRGVNRIKGASVRIN